MLVPIALLLLAAAETTPSDPAAIDEQELQQLLTVRRLFVDRFSGGETASQMRDMILTGLQNTKLFVVTENAEKADAFLRGSAEDLVFTDEHTASDSVHAQANLSRTNNTSYSGRTAGRDDTSRSQGVDFGDSESTHSLERRHEAVAAVRVVNKDGDVIWSTTQESKGGKFRGSSADVADKVTKKLVEDYDRARKLQK
jgi:hypothetical protein